MIIGVDVDCERSRREPILSGGERFVAVPVVVYYEPLYTNYVVGIRTFMMKSMFHSCFWEPD